MSLKEVVAYAQGGRGERKRPTTGWGSLTPTELDVVRLVAEGIPNKEIATRLFTSPRTVQSHLRHVYNKLGLTSGHAHAGDKKGGAAPGGRALMLSEQRRPSVKLSCYG
jgi:DNA-binding CsgD family transcriptional regulator